MRFFFINPYKINKKKEEMRKKNDENDEDIKRYWKKKNWCVIFNHTEPIIA